MQHYFCFDTANLSRTIWYDTLFLFMIIIIILFFYELSLIVYMNVVRV